MVSVGGPSTTSVRTSPSHDAAKLSIRSSARDRRIPRVASTSSWNNPAPARAESNLVGSE